MATRFPSSATSGARLRVALSIIIFTLLTLCFLHDAESLKRLRTAEVDVAGSDQQPELGSIAR